MTVTAQTDPLYTAATNFCQGFAVGVFRVLELDPVVTHRFPAAEFQEAMQLMDNRDGIVAKIVLEHSS